MSLTSAAVAAGAAVLAPAIAWTGERLLASCSRSSLASLSDRTAQLGHGRSTGGGAGSHPGRFGSCSPGSRSTSTSRRPNARRDYGRLATSLLLTGPVEVYLHERDMIGSPQLIASILPGCPIPAPPAAGQERAWLLSANPDWAGVAVVAGGTRPRCRSYPVARAPHRRQSCHRDR